MAITDEHIAKDSFWLNLAAESIYHAHEKHAKAVESLQGLIKWAFGLFTTGGVLLFFFPKSGDFSLITMILFGLTFSLLTIGYFLSANAGFPDPTKFNPNVVTEVKAAYSRSISQASKKFLSAVVFTFVGFLFLALGILFQFAQNKPPIRQNNSSLMTLKTGIERHADKSYIPVTVGYAKKQRVNVVIRGYKDESDFKSSKSPGVVIGQAILYPDTTGFCFGSYPVSDNALSYFRVSVQGEVSPPNTINTKVYQTIEQGLTMTK